MKQLYSSSLDALGNIEQKVRVFEMGSILLFFLLAAPVRLSRFSKWLTICLNEAAGGERGGIGNNQTDTWMRAVDTNEDTLCFLTHTVSFLRSFTFP